MMALETTMQKFMDGKKKNRRTIILCEALLLFFLPVLFFTPCSHAQVHVTGEIISHDGLPVPYANVLILQTEDSLLVSGGITNEEGKFIFTIQPAAYLLNVSMLGYKPHYSSIDVGRLQEQVSLSPITLSENVQELGEIVVTSKRPLIEKMADRTIINVQNSITSAGNTVLEVLEKSPGVIVNRQSGSIELNGKEGVLVMINNKMNRLPLDAVVQMLDGMSAANIGKIELITNPPAKYEAEGNAGIIHIVMKDNPDMGTNGSFGLTLGYNNAEILAGNFNLNHRGRKFNYFLNYSVHHSYNRHLSNMKRYSDINGFVQAEIDSGIRSPYMTIQNLQAGAEFIFFDKTLVYLNLAGYKRNWDTKDVGWNFFYPANDTPVITETFKKEVNIWKSSSAGIGLTHNFNERHHINLMFDYLYYDNNNPSEFRNDRYLVGSSVIERELIEIHKETPIDFKIVNFDYSGKISQFLVETGIKGSWSEFTNDVRVTRNIEDVIFTDPAFTNTSALDEKILAAYFSLNWMLQNNWNISGGLRYEFTDTYLGVPGIPALVDKSYGDFFPNLSITHNLNDNNKLHIAYRKRINRPNYDQMAPFVFFFGLNTFVAGNLSLMPAINNGAEISYQRRNWWLTLHYSNTKDFITRYQSELDTSANVLVYRSQNLDYSKSYGINTNFSFQVVTWWKMQNYFSVGRNSLRTKHLVNNLQNRKNNFSVNTSNTFVLNDKLSAEISGLYQSPVMWGFSTFIPGGSVNIGIQRKFKSNAVLSLVVNDAFSTSTWILETERENYRSRWNYDSGTRAINLTFRQQFGNRRLKGVNIKTGAEDERKRVQ
jgi:hypothetical protein